MIRILHLIGRPLDFQTERSAASLARDLGAEYSVDTRKIGRGADAFDVVHAWDDAALTIAALAGARRVVFSPGPSIGRGGIGWVRAVMNYRDVQVVAATA